MQYSKYYAMKKPEDTDLVNPSDFNDNTDTIDGQLHEINLEIAKLSSDVTAVSEDVAELKETATPIIDAVTATSSVIAELSDAEMITSIKSSDGVLIVTHKDGTVNKYDTEYGEEIE